MGSVKKMALAGTAALLSTTAFAADLSLPPPAAPLVRPVPVVVDSGGWYLRGDVGIGMQNFKSFDFTQTNAASGAVWPASWRIDQKDIGDSAFVGFGVGYAWNNWFRFDVITGAADASQGPAGDGWRSGFPSCRWRPTPSAGSSPSSDDNPGSSSAL